MKHCWLSAYGNYLFIHNGTGLQHNSLNIVMAKYTYVQWRNVHIKASMRYTCLVLLNIEAMFHISKYSCRYYWISLFHISTWHFHEEELGRCFGNILLGENWGYKWWPHFLAEKLRRNCSDKLWSHFPNEGRSLQTKVVWLFSGGNITITKFIATVSYRGLIFHTDILPSVLEVCLCETWMCCTFSGHELVICHVYVNSIIWTYCKK